MRLQSFSRVASALVVASTLMAGNAMAQAPEVDSADVATVQSIVLATYASINRAPGAPYQWDRFRSLFLPGALLISNVEQSGTFAPVTAQGFVDWIDRVAPAGGPNDRGFFEEEISHVAERYGDIAHVFSTYQKRFGDADQILGRGINSFQLVWHDNRWWITGIIWDEENAAGPIPDRYLP